jgi:hypothetical protein
MGPRPTIDEVDSEVDKRGTLRWLRKGLRQVRASGRLSEHEQDLVLRLRVSRERIAAEAGDLQACAQCAACYPLPASTWAGGYCCSGRTEGLFDEIELATLGGASTRPRHLRPPRSGAAGCIFRGARGCSLPPVHRPNKCLRYLCVDAQRELHARGALEVVEALCRDNERQFELFARVRLARLEASFCEELARRVF